MSRLGLGLVPVMAIAWSGVAFAQAPAAPAPAAPAAAPAAGAPAPASAGGTTAPAAPAAKPASTTAGAPAKKAFLGTGPFWDAVSKGDAAYIARDFDSAIKAYREGLEKDPNNAMGHYRLGEAMLAKGDLNEAEQSWQTGLRFCGKDEKLRAKLLFVLADLRERQKNWDEADARWKQYAQHVQTVPEAKGYPATATERQKRIAEWKQLNADSLVVRERIDKRIKETEESMRKSSK